MTVIVLPPRCKSEHCGRFVSKHSMNGLCELCEDGLWQLFMQGRDEELWKEGILG